MKRADRRRGRAAASNFGHGRVSEVGGVIDGVTERDLALRLTGCHPPQGLAGLMRGQLRLATEPFAFAARARSICSGSSTDRQGKRSLHWADTKTAHGRPMFTVLSERFAPERVRRVRALH